MKRLLVLLAVVTSGFVAGSSSSAVGANAAAAACSSGKALGATCYPECPLFPNWTSRTGGKITGGATSDGTGLTAKCVFDPASSLCDAVKGSCGSSGLPAVSLSFLVTFASPNTAKTTVAGCSPAASVAGTTATLSSYGQVANIQFGVDGTGANQVMFPALNGDASTNLNDIEANILGNARAFLDAFNVVDKPCKAPVLKFAQPLPSNPFKLGGRATWPLHVTGGNPGVPITITGGTPKVCVLSGSGAKMTLHIVARGVCSISAHQAGTSGSVPGLAGISFKVT